MVNVKKRTVELPEELWRRVKVVAALTDQTISQAIELSIEEYVERIERARLQQ